MEILIITSLLGDFSGIAEEVEKELKGVEKELKGVAKQPEKSPDEFVSLHAYDMILQAYDKKRKECEELKKKISNFDKDLNKEREEHFQSYRKISDMYDILANENKMLRANLASIKENVVKICDISIK